jgi:hypothetical protein
MTAEITPPTTREAAIALLDIIMTSDSHPAKMTAYEQLRQLICLLLPE